MDTAALIQQIGMPIIAVLVPLAVAGFKKLMPSIPKVLMPVVAALLGPLFDLGLSYIAGIETNGIGGALAGLAGVGVRELKDQIGKVVTPA